MTLPSDAITLTREEVEQFMRIALPRLLVTVHDPQFFRNIAESFTQALFTHAKTRGEKEEATKGFGLCLCSHSVMNHGQFSNKCMQCECLDFDNESEEANIANAALRCKWNGQGADTHREEPGI